MQKQQTTSEKVNTPLDGFIVGTDRTGCCIWCYRMDHLSSEGKRSPEAPTGGGVGAETEDDEEGATPAQSEVKGPGQTASDAAGAAVDY